MTQATLNPSISTSKSLLTPEILAEEAMLIRYRIALLESAAQRQHTTELRMNILFHAQAQKRILDRVSSWWITMHEE